MEVPLRGYPRVRRKLDEPMNQEVNYLQSALYDSEFLSKRNESYVREEVQRNRDYFDKLEKYPLSPLQCQAIVRDESRTLVVAGAGTGKTSTLVGKAAYVLRRGFAKPEEVLLLSYGRDVKDEMLERVEKRVGVPLEVSTFHALGMQILTEALGKKPTVSKISEDKAALQKFIEAVKDDRTKDPSFLRDLNNFLTHLPSYKTLWDFKTQNEYFQYLKTQQLRSLKGDLVKSHQELEIANFLYLNGVDYEYERPYEYPTANKLHGQYEPDFYLSSYKIYVEHFGVDQYGNTAPSVDKVKYREEMDWKRSLHRKHQTRLVETYSYEAKGGELVVHLEKKLKENGVKLNPIPENKVFERLNDLGLVTPIAGLLADFLTLYKSNDITMDELRQRARRSENPERTAAFIGVFAQIYVEYQKHLALQGEIDFEDMIMKATEFVRGGKVKRYYRYILVDEFQDISQIRHKLLRAILDQAEYSKLFAVGDDWQSIFRFAGSDLNVMTRFDRYYGESERLFIDESFRFNNKICDFATKFILENPSQIRKQLKTKVVTTQAAISLVYTRDPQREVERILFDLSHESGSVYILGRYHKQKPAIPQYPNLQTSFYTAHKAKGSEADYCIVLGLESGTMGFPCEIVDDPVLGLVTPEAEIFPNAEERRLFYVAITRARRHVYLLADPDKPSTFVTEILRNGYELQREDGQGEEKSECPKCGGAVVKRKSSNGDFYSCFNYPYCSYRASKCPSCRGHLLLNHGSYQCDSCDRSFRMCPHCGGALVTRVGPYSEFLGCKNYPDCRYTA
ncbi:MAG: UvrD-helicase domain-containing protein [Nitrososphaerota archaeon]|nr:UvrD-helicase domain-containing protein [Nitrososphaerota archaeon]